MRGVQVSLQATDPLSHAGLVEQLASCPELTVMDEGSSDTPCVLVVIADVISPQVMAQLRASRAKGATPIVLLLDEVLSEADLLSVIECQVVAVLPRSAANGERVIRAVLTAASGGGMLPPNLVGGLLKHVERIQREVLNPNGLNASGLTAREIDILRLLAEGHDIATVADTLCYSERTVKNVMFGMARRLKLRSRTHAVAYAVRAGVI